MKAGITIRDKPPAAWGEALARHSGGKSAQQWTEEYVRSRPIGTQFALLEWPFADPEGEDDIRPDVVTALCDVFVSCGRVAFQCAEAPLGAEIFVPPPLRPFAERAWEEVLGVAGRAPVYFGVAVTSDPGIVAHLFKDGWSWGGGDLIVFDPGVDPAPVIAALQLRKGWNQHYLPAGSRFLFGSIHEGDYALLATVKPIWRQRFEAALTDPEPHADPGVRAAEDPNETRQSLLREPLHPGNRRAR